MAERVLGVVKLGLLALALRAGAALAAPVNSDLATAQLGGGCYPTGIHPAVLDMLVLVDPEWAPLMNGMTVASTPITVHGTVQGMHGDTSGDFPATHVRADVNHFVVLDAADADRLATGNVDGELHFEWEAGTYPAWAWAGTGDRIVGMGRWIFDCGHPDAQPGNCSVTTSVQCVLDSDCTSPTCSSCGGMETCLGTHFGYSAELHPPQATAAIRSGRGAIVSSRRGATPVPATKADVYVSPYAGGAGDACVLTHRADPLNLLGIECFPLARPVAPINAQDFAFDLPMPPRPVGGRPRWRIIPLPAPGGTAARVRVHRRLRDPQPRLQIIVRMTRRVHHMLPTGYAGTIVAGWRNDPTPLTHVRVTVSGLVVNNALQLATPVAPKTCASNDSPCNTAGDCPSGDSCLGVGPVKSWVMQAAVNGEWQELTGLDTVNTSDVIPQALVYDQYLPATGAVHLEAAGAAHECVDTLYGKSLATDLVQLGFTKGLACLNATAHPPGTLDLTYAGPDFGAGGSGSMDYETVSSGGEGGQCSMTTGLACVVNEDCPSPETCTTTGGAFSLRYRIERLP